MGDPRRISRPAFDDGDRAHPGHQAHRREARAVLRQIVRAEGIQWVLREVEVLAVWDRHPNE